MNEFAPWQEWGERCAADLCSEDTQAALHEFASMKWSLYLERGTRGSEIPGSGKISSQEAWQRFENYCWIKPTGEGKSTKSYLFTQLDIGKEGTPTDIVRASASLIMRSVVRDFLRHEGPLRFPGHAKPALSLSDAPPNSRESLTYEDLLRDTRDPSKEAEFRELEQLAVTEAVEILAGLKERQLIVITACALGIALSNPEVEKIAECKKSVLSEELKKTLRDIEKRIHKDYAEEDVRGRIELAEQVFRAIHNICSQPKNQPEMWQSRLFSLATDIEK